MNSDNNDLELGGQVGDWRATYDQHEQRLQNRQVSDRLRRDQESQEEHDQRLQRRRERDALARQEESQEQHEQRLERRRVSDRLRS